VGRPPATVRVWLHRARAAFAKGWQRQSNIEGDDLSEEEES
jgi:hypothetical protein